MPPNFFNDLLSQVPRAAYFNAIRPFTQSPNRQRFFDFQFEPTYNQYLGRLGQQLSLGQPPTLQFNDFLQGQDFNNLFWQQGQNGFGASNFNPRTRWLTGF